MAIRSAIAYGAGVWHRPGNSPRGITTKLLTLQSQCLRRVGGAYKATPIRHLETETATPPLDLYLNKWVATMEERLQRNGMRTLIDQACSAIAGHLRRRPRRNCRAAATPTLPLNTEAGMGRTNWAAQWAVGRTPEDSMYHHWKERVDNQAAARALVGRGRGAVPADKTPNLKSLTTDTLRKHNGLRKHESSLLLQIRTGKIGLRAFLFEKKVPEVYSPRCQCGDAAETPQHLALDCSETRQERQQLESKMSPGAIRTYQDFVYATEKPQLAATLVRWFLNLGRFTEFRLAREIAHREDTRAEGYWQDEGRPPEGLSTG
jgi:hypothetical protein